MAVDSSFDKVILLLHADGANDSTAFVDSSPTPKIVTAYNGAKISTSKSKFGGASFDFSGAPSHVRITPTTDFAFGTGDFTLECWVNYSVHSGARPIALFNGSSGVVQLYISGGALVVETSDANGGVGGSVPLNVWTHLAVSRESGVVRSFINGVKVYQYTDAGALGAPSNVNINQYGSGGGYGGTGFVDEVRITKGLARYTTDFTPATEPFGGFAALSGYIKDAANAPAARLVRALREDTGAAVGYATSDAVTGAYSIDTPHIGAHTLNAYPAAGENLPALTLRGVVPV